MERSTRISFSLPSTQNWIVNDKLNKAKKRKEIFINTSLKSYKCISWYNGWKEASGYHSHCQGIRNRILNEAEWTWPKELTKKVLLQFPEGNRNDNMSWQLYINKSDMILTLLSLKTNVSNKTQDIFRILDCRWLHPNCLIITITKAWLHYIWSIL
jgi:hypothetical protein